MTLHNEFLPLTEESLPLYAGQHYDNPTCTGLDEFYEDLNRVKYIKRWLSRHSTTKSTINHQLILNHIIIFFNVFGIEAATRILLYKIDTKHYSTLKTFLIYLSFYNGQKFWDELGPVDLDHKVVATLGNL